jgi:hypothetical protein
MKRFIVVLVSLIFLFVGVAFAQQTTPAPAGGKAISDKADTTKKDKEQKKEDKDKKDKKDKAPKETGKSQSAGGY